jgi:hypothetical protein
MPLLPENPHVGIGANFLGHQTVLSTSCGEAASKSPFEKGGFRGIFSTLDKNPPCPPFAKGGN